MNEDRSEQYIPAAPSQEGLDGNVQAEIGYKDPDPETTRRIREILEKPAHPANSSGTLVTGSKVTVENLPAEDASGDQPAVPEGHNEFTPESAEDRKKAQADAAIGIEESRRRLQAKDGE